MSQTEQRVTNLEIKVEDLTKELRNAMSFINTLRVMYEMQHPNEEDKSQAVSLASTIVDDEESIDLQLTPVIVGHEEEKLQAVSLASTIVDVEESVDLQLTLPSLVPTIVDELSLEPTLVEDTHKTIGGIANKYHRGTSTEQAETKDSVLNERFRQPIYLF